MAENPKQIRIPPITWKRVRRAALDLDMSASEFVRRSVIRALVDFDRTGSISDTAVQDSIVPPREP